MKRKLLPLFVLLSCFSCNHSSSYQNSGQETIVITEVEPLGLLNERDKMEQDTGVFRDEKEQPPVPTYWIADSIQRFMDRYPSANPLYGVGEPDLEIKIANSILYWKEDRKEHTVTVWLSQLNDKVKEGFRREVINSPQIRFKKTSPLLPFEKNWGWTKDDFWWEGPGYYLTMAKQNFTLPMPEEVAVTLHNETDNESTTGCYYWVEYKDNGQWKNINFITNDNLGFAFPDIGIPLNSNSRHRFTIPLHPDLYDYQPGEYRIRKKFRIEGRFRMEGNSRFWEKYYVSIPFWIE